MGRHAQGYPPGVPPADAARRRPRTLVLRALGLGDLLAGVPALRALRRALPGHEITLAAPAALGPVVALVDAVDRHLPTEELAPVPWQGDPPEVAVDLHGNGEASHRLLLDLRPGRVCGFAWSARDPHSPAWDPDEHERARWCRLVATSFDVPADPGDVGIRVPAEPPPVPGAVVVHPGAAYPSRRWPTDRFAAVARWASKQGQPVAVTGGPGERGLAEAVRRTAGLGPGAVLAGRTGPAALAALVADARLVVCGDTGPAHLASAYRTPSVLLFGPTPPDRWGPPADGPHTVLWHGRGVGDPWAATPDPALLRIGVDEVVSAARSLLAREAAPAPPG